jgi:hypothetical protein
LKGLQASGAIMTGEVLLLLMGRAQLAKDELTGDRVMLGSQVSSGGACFVRAEQSAVEVL